jgi:sugar lactone lactonase YvrE
MSALRKRLRSALLGGALLCGALAGADAPDADARARSLEFQKKAVEAYQRQDWPAFLENAQQAEALRPGNPRLLYNVACAQARNGQAAAAAKTLEGLIARKLDLGSDGDGDFAAVRDSEAFAGVRRALAQLRQPVGGSTVAFRLAEKDLLTEGIAYDPASKAFFVSSVHRRKIVRRAADGTVSDFVKEGQYGVGAVLALALDEKRGRLIACSAALPQMKGYTPSLEGRSAVYEFDLATGKPVRNTALPVDGKPHAANDLAVAENGDLYVTDSLGSGIYRIPSGGGALETFVAPGVFRSPGGIAFGPGGRLYVADWGQGLYWLDSGRNRHEVEGPPDVPLFGIDGLIARGGTLYAVQNGIAPARVVRLELDAKGGRVVAAAILDMNDPEFFEPTLATLVGDDLYVIGKSQWPLFDEKTGAFDPAKLKEPVILRVSTGR